MELKDYLLETPLFFSHGIEVENHLVDIATGEVLVGNELLSTWDEMFAGAAKYLERLKKAKHTPKTIAKKIVKIEVTEEIKREKRLNFIFIHYRLGKRTVRVNVFGPDPNISQITWLLELVTPPCEYLEEIAFWIDSLYAAAAHGLSKVKNKFTLLPIGLNPMEKRVRSGLTCGEHHHIGIPSFFRAPVYNMLRNYIPHLIALSSTSPFLNQKSSGKIIVKEKDGKKQVISRGIHSYRLANNTGQMGPNIPQYLPIIDDMTTREDFARAIKKVPPEDRMIDLFPYTDYSTIELRFFDAQPWRENRLAMVLLIQALAQKTKELIKQKKPVPTVSSLSLYENRRKAVQFGLLAQFTRDENLTGEFAWFYNYDIENGVKASKLMHSVLALLIYIEDELLEFNSAYLDQILLPVLGSKKFAPPFSVCDYLFSLYTDKGQNMNEFLKEVYYTEKLTYPPQVAGDFSSFLVENPPDSFIEVDEQQQNLTQLLKQDIATRQEFKSTPSPIPKKRKKKKPVAPKEKPVTEIPKKEPAVVPRKTPPKKKVPSKKTKPPESPKPKKPVEVGAKPKAAKKEPVTIPQQVVKVEEKQVISAFDENEDLEIYSPMIEIEPKYQKINSKIANIMRTRRQEIEAKRIVFFREHLKEEESKFKPFPKKQTAVFPALISGPELFGYIEFSFSDIKKVMYQFRNNPITLRFYDNQTNNEIATLRTFVDISRLEKRQMVRIPCSISLGELYGKLKLRVEAVTSTNHRLLPKNFVFTVERKDEISISPKEFYITSNFGSVECIYKATNDSKKEERGDLTLLLATQASSTPIVIYEEKFTLKPRASFEFARSIDLSIDYQHSSFYILARITTGLLKKNRAFKSIHVPVLREIVVDWSFVTRAGSKNDLWQGVEPKTHYAVDFVFHFLRSLPPVSIAIYVNTFPQGETKKLTSLQLKRYIDKGDEFSAPTVKFKTPKKCGYLIFDAQIRTEKGILPMHLLSEPIGVYGLTTKSTFEKRKNLDL
ncbi:MAG: glutamate-cysteine ligase family protein [Candidatus Hodarchaeales archaeon]|jgi:hypothetical protein